MGAKKQEFALTQPNAKASKGRTYALYCAVGVDVRKTGLTNKQAHALLNRANGGEAYHVRAELLEMGGLASKKDVAKEHRGDPKPRKTANGKGKTKGNGKNDEAAQILALLKKHPDVLKALLADGDPDEDEEDAEDDEEEQEEPKSETKAQKRARVEKQAANTQKSTTKKSTTAKGKGTRVTTKSGANVTINDDGTISDADLLAILEKTAYKAASAK